MPRLLCETVGRVSLPCGVVMAFLRDRNDWKCAGDSAVTHDFGADLRQPVSQVSRSC